MQDLAVLLGSSLASVCPACIVAVSSILAALRLCGLKKKRARRRGKGRHTPG